jgi:hypothetical protein
MAVAVDTAAAVAQNRATEVKIETDALEAIPEVVEEDLEDLNNQKRAINNLALFF